jgi:acetolactate synthase regulatory subunit
MTIVEQRTFHVMAVATPDAVERAKAIARLEGFAVVAVARVALVPPGWDVTLAVRGARAGQAIGRY